MSTTPRTDAVAKDWKGHEDYDVRLEPLCRQLELENIKLLEVARLAKQSLSYSCNAEKLDNALKSLEESGVKI